ncbi:hypothetical protein FRB99_007191, partial [Tulasnella sp. 403]
MDRRFNLTGSSGVVVAVKKLRTMGHQKTFLRVAIGLVREVQLLAHLDHPNILPLIGFYLDQEVKEAWLVVEYAPNGNALEFLNERQPDLQERVELIKDTIKGLQYLYIRSPPISHGDIKPVNILISGTGRAMLCDFGLSKAEKGHPSGFSTSDFTHAGTLRYQSPELLEQDTLRSLESDIWAWGCLALELTTGQAPYSDVLNDAAIVGRICNRIAPATIEEIDVPEPLPGLLGRCWEHDPAKRPSATVCLNLMTGMPCLFKRRLMRKTQSPVIAEDKRVFLQQSLWASPAVVETLQKDLATLLTPLESLRIRRSLFTIIGEEPIGGN